MIATNCCWIFVRQGPANAKTKNNLDAAAAPLAPVLERRSILLKRFATGVMNLRRLGHVLSPDFWGGIPENLPEESGRRRPLSGGAGQIRSRDRGDARAVSTA
jgi:hypothetical protein